MEKPAQIFNLNEMGMPLDPSPPLVAARHSQKHPSAVGSGEKWCSHAPVLLDMLSFPVLFLTDRSSIPSLQLGKYLVLCTDY